MYTRERGVDTLDVPCFHSNMYTRERGVDTQDEEMIGTEGRLAKSN